MSRSLRHRVAREIYPAGQATTCVCGKVIRGGDHSWVDKDAKMIYCSWECLRRSLDLQKQAH